MATKTLFHQLVDELWINNNTEIISEVFAPDCVIHGPGGDIVGHDGFLTHYQMLKAAFEVISMQIPYTVTEGDLCMARFELSHRHIGDFMGISATGKEVLLTGNSLGRIREGKFVEGWDEFNLFGLIQQLNPG